MMDDDLKYGIWGNSDVDLEAAKKRASKKLEAISGAIKSTGKEEQRGDTLQEIAEQWIEQMRSDLVASAFGDESRADEWNILDNPATLKWLEGFARVVQAEQRARAAAIARAHLDRYGLDGEAQARAISEAIEADKRA